MTNLFNYELRVADDSAKPDLALICLECGEHLCDAEHGDSLHSLVATCEDHAEASGHGR
ncbi:Uncharacterised protein (plasmid) [Tsukamurella tyrosinosolvens]|uniref:Uncharacterized protein n=1 Tax=Tsukamurella tyrosinosolvens TaxID=57704 RepID=A0A1H4VCR6_TSUTY|nr:hypothetical protein [Tsukamurella tyrosinosolvens]SEC78787.1 hypothetical protein SAMN04489793_3195 [Tsukamurella tyrosinosolvens]VEH90584.1 Uncharacterised protein [Tsukamurella tyrosinosolvens]